MYQAWDVNAAKRWQYLAGLKMFVILKVFMQKQKINSNILVTLGD